jgi:hypothetical protein
VARDGYYVDTDIVKAGESFMIYINVSETTMLTVRFTPFKNNYAVSVYQPDWQMQITASLTNDFSITDEIKVSLSDRAGQGHYSLMLNNLEPIRLPENMAFYLREADVKYNTRTIVAPEEEEFELLPFTLEIPALESVRFGHLFSQLPNYGNIYQISLILDDNEFLFEENVSFDYTPTELTVNGYIKIYNAPVSTVDQIARPFTVSTYPNPFNPSTNIAFNLPKNAHVELNVYNIKGQRVKTLANQTMSQGNHVIKWNGVDSYNRKVGSGIYFVMINVEGQDRVMKKITLLK